MYGWMNDHKENTLVTYKNLRSPSKTLCISIPFQPLLLYLSVLTSLVITSLHAIIVLSLKYASVYIMVFFLPIKKKNQFPLSPFLSFTVYLWRTWSIYPVACPIVWVLLDCVWMMQFSMFFSFVCPAIWQLDPEAWLNLCLIPLADQRWWCDHSSGGT